MFDLITLGTVSADFFIKGESLTFADNRFQLAVGGKYFTEDFKETVGGGGANVAIGASKNGLKTAVCSKIGNNVFKKMILARLKKYNVSTAPCYFDNDYRNFSVILLNKHGERTIINSSPKTHDFLHQRNLKSRLAWSKMVYLGNMPHSTIYHKNEILKFLKSKNILTIVNFGVNDCREQVTKIVPLMENIDILIVNGHEFSELVKEDFNKIDFATNVVQKYIPSMTDKILVVTLDKKGSYAYHSSEVFHQLAFSVEKIVDTTGAGDAFTSAFIASYYKHKNIEKALQSGAHYASHILGKIGAN